MKVDWTRDPVPTPPATFTVTLTEDEAKTLLRLFVTNNALEFRKKNPLVYELDDALNDALFDSGV